MKSTKLRKLNTLSQAELKENLHYDPQTGIFIRKLSAANNKVKIGSVAGSPTVKGYLAMNINGTQYQAHRLAWLYVYGYMPTEFIDHKNGVRSDNRIDNLREADYQKNVHNQTRAHCSNKTGFLGVAFNKKLNKYGASITVDNKQRHLGVFCTPEEAHEAYLKAKRELHPFSTI